MIQFPKITKMVAKFGKPNLDKIINYSNRNLAVMASPKLSIVRSKHFVNTKHEGCLCWG